MQEAPEQEREGLGLPPLPLQVMLRHLTSHAKTQLLRTSRSVRDEVLLSAEALLFTPGAKSQGSRSQQLVNVLQQRKEPLKLTLDMGKGPQGEQMAAFLTDAAAASRPQVHGLQGGSRCCVKELTVQGVQDNTHEWGELLGAAFPHITSLTWWWSCQLDVPVVRGLAACTRLTKLDLENSQPTAALAASAPMLRAWLPHVRSLVCRRSAAGVALAQGMAAQLQHLEVSRDDDPVDIVPCLRACVQLVSCKLWADVSQALLDVLVQIPSLKDVTVKGSVDISAPAAATGSMQSLTVRLLDLEDAAFLPLATLQKLIAPSLFFQLQSSPEASAAAMHDACAALAAVSELQVQDLRMCHTDLDDAADLNPEECAQHLEAALAAMHPLAGKLTAGKLALYLDWLEGPEETDDDSDKATLGPEAFRGLHTAFGAALVDLYIGPTGWDVGYWAPTKEFWQVLPDALPQLQRLMLTRVSRMSFGASLALSVMCSKMVQAGRSIEIVFADPSGEIWEGVGVLQEFQPLVRVRRE